MKIEVLILVLDKIDPDALYSCYGPVSDEQSFLKNCKVECLENLSPADIDFTDPEISKPRVTWKDVKARYVAEELDFATKEMRAKRNALLKESDVEVLPDRTPSDEIKAYRQALRDLPSTELPTYNANGELQVNWPIKPQTKS